MRALSGVTLPVAAVLALGTLSTSVGCRQIGELQANRAMKQANQAYAAQDYPHAAELYEEAIAKNPELSHAYFYLGNSYDNQYKPSRKGEADNDVFLQKAIQNYQLAADKLTASEDPEMKSLGELSLDYLVATYGPDKLADPASQEPIVQRMIQLEPNDPENYWKLAKIYEDAGVYVEAEQMYMRGREVKPDDPQVFMQLAGYYSRQGELEKMFAALAERARLEPNNPEAFQMIAGYYEEATRSDSRLTEVQKRDYVAKGLEAVDTALKLNPEYFDALVFKNLLLRQQALLEKDPAKQKQLLDDANMYRDRAQEIRKKQTGAAATQ